MDNKIPAIKEKVDPNEIPRILNDSVYPKPRWMLNESVYDKCWRLAENGIELSFYENNESRGQKLNFEVLVSPNEYLTDKINKLLLIDIQHSLLYLDVKGKITRSERIRKIAVTVINLIYHANEIRIAENKPLIRSLEHISYYDLKSYLLAFDVVIDVFEETLSIILETYNNSNEINWNHIESKLKLTRREFLSLKHRLNEYFKSHEYFYSPESPSRYVQRYQNANRRKFDTEITLKPNESTISNTISKIEALFTSKAAQKYPFKHSPMALFKSGRELFDHLREREKTPLMPVNVSLHAISSALGFIRNYGEPLQEYISELFIAEDDRIKELDLAFTTAYSRYYSDIKSYSFNKVIIPDGLKELNITSWERLDSEIQSISFDDFKNGMSIGIVVRLYVAAIWIVIASFVAGRTTSLRTLKRNCFVQSPIDGFFDIVLRIPKSSERFELEEVHRPIPDLIYDYGLQFASFSCLIEDRRSLVADENDLYLFGNALSYRSISAGLLDDGGEIFKIPLSDDYIKGCLDMFQDWSCSPLIDGKRWYCNTHQFRRLFAVLYFNFSDDTGLDELSWFVGHSNLDQTFHYAEVSPTDEWVEEAENTIARTGANLHNVINADEDIINIVEEARKISTISSVLEPLVHTLIDEHKKKTGQVVRFYKIDGNEVFFYFCNPNGESHG